MKRQLKGLVAAAIIAGLMAGCGSTGQQETGKAADKPAEAAAKGKLSGKFEIQYFVGGYGDKWWKQAISDFKAANTGLDIVEYAGPNVNTEMKTRWISNTPPDLVYIAGAGSSEAQMVADDQLMDLTEWARTLKLEDGTPLLSSFFVKPGEYNGKMYALPLVLDAWGTWYDRSWMKQNGYKVPSDFNTWLDTMKDVKEKGGIAPLVTDGKHPYPLRGLLMPGFAAEGGEKLIADLVDAKEGAWKSEPVLKVVKKVEQMQKAGYIDPGFAALNHTQSQMNFLLHKNAFIPVGFWLPFEMQKDVPQGFDFGFIPTPMQDPGKPFAMLPQISPLAIAKKAKNPEAAKAFIDFVFKRKYAELSPELQGAMLNIKGVNLDNNPKIPPYLKEVNALVNDKSKVTFYSLPHPMSADLEKPVFDQLVSLMLGQITAEEFVQRAEKAAADFRKNSK
ncbi:sugar ABC transporter substrate-binding protein [Gordoniibacillus kamchatkensis]|uniref:Sugar ABC transporter substrate-binding protein n=1 Tax=Gordoniibacillus kamchatkensis TaxID=1590651 RepID=A0ABR5AB59_9BACL|nr:ABC transporter substrate-binding protein [Paenibacillus sp. VKM B-2647]KIL37825.1 sugar ABC transporter substrate-binding protein [Paenibacillus sp. VKM B-2647]